MKKITLNITEKQHERLQGLFKESGIRQSEAIRRAIDFYFNEQDKIQGKKETALK